MAGRGQRVAAITGMVIMTVAILVIGWLIIGGNQNSDGSDREGSPTITSVDGSAATDAATGGTENPEQPQGQLPDGTDASGQPAEGDGAQQQVPQLTSQTLHSDGQRIVLHSADASDPVYVVITYAGTQVTSLQTCIEHGSEAAAKQAATEVVPNEGEGVRSAYAEGTCLVIEHTPESYANLTIANISETYPDMLWI